MTDVLNCQCEKCQEARRIVREVLAKIERSEGATLTDLERRLSEAKEGSRELDARIGIALDNMDRSWLAAYQGEGIYEKEDIMPRYTSSLDAAVALAEAVLPGSHVSLGWNSAYAVARLEGGYDAQKETPALALCLAIVRALKEKA